MYIELDLFYFSELAVTPCCGHIPEVVSLQVISKITSFIIFIFLHWENIFQTYSKQEAQE